MLDLDLALSSSVVEGQKSDGVRANEALKMKRAELLAAILQQVDALPIEDADRLEIRIRTLLTRTSVLREIHAEDVFGEYARRELQGANAGKSQLLNDRPEERQNKVKEILR